MSALMRRNPNKEIEMDDKMALEDILDMAVKEYFDQKNYEEELEAISMEICELQARKIDLEKTRFPERYTQSKWFTILEEEIERRINEIKEK
jgi:hypothetical protein